MSEKYGSTMYTNVCTNQLHIRVFKLVDINKKCNLMSTHKVHFSLLFVIDSTVL